MRRLSSLLLPLAALAAGLVPLTTQAAQSATVNFLPVADTYVHAGFPTENYGTGDTLFLSLGTPPNRSRILLRFNLATIPAGSQIQSADLSLYARSFSGASTIPLFASLAAGAWEETTVTWDTKPAPTSTLPDVPASRDFLTHTLPVTSLVQKAVDAPSAYSGFDVASRETGTSFTWGYGSRESAQPALLAVTYVPPTDTVAPAIVERRIENVGLTSADVVVTSDEAVDLTVEFGLDATYGRTMSSTSTATSHRLTLFPLASNSLYHYRVRLRDAAGNETVGTDATFSTLESSGAVAAGTLIKIPNDNNPATVVDSAVYYMGSDGKRHAFPNAQIYFSWYADFSGVQTISVAQMGTIQLGANVRFRPGTRMVKFATVPTVYAIARGGVLRAISNEGVAAAIYGSAWATLVSDLPDVLFGNYSFGTDITAAGDFDPAAETASTTTIDQDQGRA